MFSVHTTQEEFKNAAESPYSHSHLCLRETQAEKNHDYPIVIVYEKPVFKLFSAYSETRSQRFLISPVYSEFWKFFRSRNGLVWKAGLTVE